MQDPLEPEENRWKTKIIVFDSATLIENKEFSKYSLIITLLFIDYRNRFKNAAELLQLIKEVGRKLELIDFKDDQNNSNVSNVDLIGVETTKNDNENGNKHTSIFLMLSYLWHIHLQV